MSLTILEVMAWFKEIHEGGRITSPLYDGADKIINNRWKEIEQKIH